MEAKINPVTDINVGTKKFEVDISDEEMSESHEFINKFEEAVRTAIELGASDIMKQSMSYFMELPLEQRERLAFHIAKHSYFVARKYMMDYFTNQKKDVN